MIEPSLGDLGDAHAKLRRIIARTEAALSKISDPMIPEPDGKAIAEALRAGGLLVACLPQNEGGCGLAHWPDRPAHLLEALVGTGRANLSAGRLFEGHVNAVKLFALYGSEELKADVFDIVRRGGLLAVWGADGRKKVVMQHDPSSVVTLAGEKMFASGMDCAAVAVVTATDQDKNTVLITLPVDGLRGRMFPDEWRVSGMKATASGRCDLEGFEVSARAVIGRAGDYLREPHFHGGVWRYAAVQLGGMQALARATISQLHERNQMQAPIQATRLREIVSACETAKLWLTAAVEEIERPNAGPETVPTAILARLNVVREATRLISLVDEALGAASFCTDHPAERTRRDLQFYIRQANPDALGQLALEQIASTGALRERWGLA